MALRDSILRLREFHKAFDLHSGDIRELPPFDKQKLHYSLLREELDEFLKGCENRDLSNIAHELADLQFIIFSSVDAHGLGDVFDDVFNEVCDSNMSKLGLDGKPVYREDGKVMRGENYKYPDVSGIIGRYKSELQVADIVDSQIKNR